MNIFFYFKNNAFPILLLSNNYISESKITFHSKLNKIRISLINAKPNRFYCTHLSLL